MTMTQQMQSSAYPLKYADVRKLIVAAPNFRDRCVVKTLFWFGLRREELAELDIRDIDFERRRITVRMGKGEKTRVIPSIDEETLNDLRHLIGERQTGPVFLSGRNRKFSLRQVNYITQGVGVLARVHNPNPRLSHINPHIFRHSIARHLKNQGLSGEFIQNFLGHESIKTTMDTYGTMSLDEMEEMATTKLGV